MKTSSKYSFLVLVCILTLTLGFWSYTRAEGSSITVCVKKSGIVHVIGSEFKKDDCKNGENLLTWNIQGPKGDKGEKGEKGDKGEPGQPSWNESRIAALEARIAALENSVVLPPSSICTAILCENFNSYSDGPIIGQGGWIDRVNGSTYAIQSSIVKEGTKALHSINPSVDRVVTKTSADKIADGKQAFWIYAENRNNWSDYSKGENVQVRVSENSWDGPAYAVLALKKDGHAAYFGNVDGFENFDTYTDNTWVLAEIEWRSSDKSARYRINNGTWTSWIPFHGVTPSFSGFNTVGFGSILLGSGGAYFDDLH